MVGIGRMALIATLGAVLAALLLVAACGRSDEAQTGTAEAPAESRPGALRSLFLWEAGNR